MKSTKISAFILSVIIILTVFLPFTTTAQESGYLSEICFGTSLSAASKGNISLDKEFDPTIHDYTVYVMDGQSSIYAWVTLSEAGKGKKIECKYKNAKTSADTSVVLTSGQATGKVLTSAITKSFADNTLTFVVDTQTYTVNIVRVASLSSLSIKINGESQTFAEKFAYTTKDYSSLFPYSESASAEITATATTASDTVIKVVGSNTFSNIPLTFDKDKIAKIEVSVFKAGAEETTKSIYTITVKAPTIDGISGYGSKTEPFEITSGDDMKAIAESVKSGITFKGCVFSLKNDITLPDDYEPIGTSVTKYPFSAEFDGNNHLITIPKGGKAPFGATVEAYLHDFNIYGEEIDGSAVVDIYTTGVSNVNYVTIDNVNLKSGTKTLKAGYITGYASGSANVIIKNCTVEKDVIIGYDKSQKWIGSFGGEFNGVVENCVSHATLYGTDFVGGIVADKGQTMGKCDIINCNFDGKIVSTGNYVGGIIGHGYGGTQWGFASAPNTPCVIVKNCVCSGNIEGANYVGGILGGDVCVIQCWENGIGEISGNKFSGFIKATEKNAYIGGIIGFFNSLNRNTIIENNTYTDNCGAKKGIGGVKYIDTNITNPTVLEDVVYVNTQNGKPTVGGMSRYYPNYEYWRTDDPMGVDADKLTLMVKSEETDSTDNKSENSDDENNNTDVGTKNFDSSSESNNKNITPAKAGDTINIELYIIFAILSACVVTYIFILKKCRKKI